MDNEDLFLHYQFTDRGSSKVYDAYLATDRMSMRTRLFTVRINLKGESTIEDINLPIED